MKLSIEQLLIVRQRNFAVLNRAFSVVLGEKYRSESYELTAEDAKLVAAEVEKAANEAEQDSDLFPLTADQKWANIREANEAAEAFRDLIYNVFKL